MMEEHHFQNVEDVGIAFDRETNRVWVCINGQSILRAKLMMRIVASPLSYHQNTAEPCLFIQFDKPIFKIISESVEITEEVWNRIDRILKDEGEQPEQEGPEMGYI